MLKRFKEKLNLVLVPCALHENAMTEFLAFKCSVAKLLFDAKEGLKTNCICFPFGAIWRAPDIQQKRVVLQLRVWHLVGTLRGVSRGVILDEGGSNTLQPSKVS